MTINGIDDNIFSTVYCNPIHFSIDYRGTQYYDFMINNGMLLNSSKQLFICKISLQASCMEAKLPEPVAI